jgi:uncharacterized protein YjbI with pentapeptide repeats
MRPVIFLTLAAAMVLGQPALAQNASQIAQVRAGANCPGCNLFQADLAGLEIAGRNYAGARLRQADMSLAVLNRANLSRTDLRDVNAYGGVFSSTRFNAANLTNADFVGTYLQGANLTGADLTGTNFSGAEMDRALGLTQTQLNKACGDESTRLPRGLTLPRC